MMFGIEDTQDYKTEHLEHKTTIIWANMVSILQCDTCKIVLAVWNREEDLLWKDGMSRADLVHYAGHEYLEEAQ